MAVPPPLPASADVKAGAKRALRARLRAARMAFAGSATEATRLALARNVADAAAGAAVVGGYVAARGEPDVLAALSASGQAIALPRTEADGGMGFVAWSSGAPLVAGQFGIGEPRPGTALVPDLLLVPLVGFDRAGNRLGQGGGYYDRWLVAHPDAMAIGVAWSIQEVAALAPDPWDRPMHAIVTECGIIRP